MNHNISWLQISWDITQKRQYLMVVVCLFVLLSVCLFVCLSFCLFVFCPFHEESESSSESIFIRTFLFTCSEWLVLLWLCCIICLFLFAVVSHLKALLLGQDLTGSCLHNAYIVASLRKTNTLKLLWENTVKLQQFNHSRKNSTSWFRPILICHMGINIQITVLKKPIFSNHSTLSNFQNPCFLNFADSELMPASVSTCCSHSKKSIFFSFRELLSCSDDYMTSNMLTYG